MAATSVIDAPAPAVDRGIKATMPSRSAAIVVAGLSAGAGAIHLAMVPSHAGASSVEAIGFAMAGWTQLALAVALVRQPTRSLMRWTGIANLAFMGAWMWSRRYGLPIGAHPWHAETIGGVDLTCVALEAAAVLIAAWALLRPAPNDADRVHVFAPLLAAGALVVASAAIMSPSAASHASDGHGGHLDVQAAGAVGAGAHDHTQAAGVQPAAAEPGHFGENHHHVENKVQYDQLPEETRREVDITREFYVKYPTGADAAKAGWFKMTTNLPGIASHYYPIAVAPAASPEQLALVDKLGFDIYKPMLLYKGEGPDAPIAGVSYLVSGVPTGFTGTWDVWHEHLGVCFKGFQVISDIGTDAESKISLTDAQCTAAGGRTMSIAGQYMVHIWSKPGFESPAGIFSHDHEGLYEGATAPKP